MKVLIKILALGIGLMASSGNAAKLDFSQHRMSVGGQAQITYDSGNISSLGIFETDVNLSYGYFVLNSFLVGGNIEVGNNFNGFSEFRLAFGPNFLFAFDTNTIASPYLEFGLGFTLKEASVWRYGIGLKPALGVLLALNNAVALDLGVVSKIDIPLGGLPNRTTIKGAVGHVGVRVFF